MMLLELLALLWLLPLEPVYPPSHVKACLTPPTLPVLAAACLQIG